MSQRFKVISVTQTFEDWTRATVSNYTWNILGFTQWFQAWWLYPLPVNVMSPIA